MKKLVFVGLLGVGLVWFVIGWIRAHGFLDLLSGLFIVVSLVLLGGFTVVVLRGEAGG